MQKCIDYLPRKSFNTYGVVLLTLYGLFAVVIISISGSLAFDLSFHCYDKTISKEVSLIKNINIKCSLQYQEKFHFILPMYAMFILNFGIVFALSIIYGYLVKHRVEKFDKNQVILLSPNLGQNPRDVRECLGRFSTFFIYVVHLLVARIIPMLIFAIWIFYQAQFPKNFSCPLGPEMQGKGTSNFSVTLNSRNNLTFIDCTNPIGGKSKTLVYIVAIVDVCLVTLSFLELGYIAWLAFNDRDFMNDEEFCTVYLLRKRKRIRKFLNKLRERFNGEEVFGLTDDFGGTEISMRPLEDIYVNVVIQEGRERMNAYPREFERHEIYQSHLETPRTVIKLTSTADIFKPTKSRMMQSYPRTILVIGRPGIGKTMLTKKLLHQWKGKEDEFWHEKIVILLQFRTFNNITVTLREMFGFAKGLSSDDFETVYDFILSNPTNIVILFDGLDELNVDSLISCTNREKVNSLNEKMPVFSIFKMLVHGRLLRGVTILTTSRPTAQHLFRDLNFERTVEVLGFFEEQIKQYVFKFCDNESTSNWIWNQIQGSAEMRSLCYIPVNSYIVCLTLKESIENDESGLQLHESLSKSSLGTITELYKRAVKVLLYRHHPKYRSQTRPSDYLIIPFPKELEKDLMELKEVAKKGICDGQLIFERTSRDEFGDLANCGLFTKLPDKQRNLFCFLHLTLQEFLAAAKVVDDMDKVMQFLDDHVKDPKWHLVIQFVAGLVGDKLREDPKEYKNQKVLADIQKRLEEWAFLLGNKETNEIALLAIKCLYELQDIDIMKSVSSKVLAEGDGMLYLEGLNIAAVDSTALFMFLGNSKNLKQLYFFQCTIQDNCNYHFKSLLITAGNTITSFTWILGRLSDVAVEYLSKALKSENCKLTELYLRSNEITDQGVEYLSKALKSENCKLTELYLGSNEITDQGIEYLSAALKSENCKLTEMNLRRNEITDQGVEYLSEALKSENCKLTELNLRRNEITDQVVEYLREGLKSKNCKLTKLELGCNKITDQGVGYLSEALKSENCKLTKLDLGYNKITNQGVEYLSEALKSKHSKLTELYLGGNKITDQGQGVKYLCEALKSENCKLTKLDLGGNEITDQGVELLSEALKSKKCKLTELYLAGNEITDQVAEYLSEALESENCKLTKLDFDCYEINL